MFLTELVYKFFHLGQIHGSQEILLLNAIV